MDIARIMSPITLSRSMNILGENIGKGCVVKYDCGDKGCFINISDTHPITQNMISMDIIILGNKGHRLYFNDRKVFIGNLKKEILLANNDPLFKGDFVGDIVEPNYKN